VAYGNLPDECTTIDQITEAQTSDTLTLEITTNRQTDRVCSSAIKPFEEIIPLNVAGLSAGIYTVKVNNHKVAFELGIDNIIP
jgi:inhibitor of cysteine peptidase